MATVKDSTFDTGLDDKEFREALESFEKMHEAITPRWLKDRQAGFARRGMVRDMKANSHSRRLIPMHGVTTSRRYTSKYGVRVGVVKNDTDEFPDFSAQALASVLEHGTVERFRQLKSAGIITGRVSTGKIREGYPKPWLRPAFDRNVKQLMDDVEDAVERKVMKEI